MNPRGAWSHRGAWTRRITVISSLSSPVTNRLHLRPAALRSAHASLRGRDSFCYNENARPRAGIIAYRRSAPGETALVFLNFADSPLTMTIPFPTAGTYRELVDDAERVASLALTGATGDPMTVTVPSKYGYVFIGPG